MSAPTALRARERAASRLTRGVVFLPMLLHANPAAFSFTFISFGGYLYPPTGGEQTG